MIFSKTTVRISAAAAAASAAVMTGVITTTHVSAVLYGDEQYGDVSGGKFWAFYSGGIAVIDPSTCTIEETIVSDHDGNPLPTSWNDGVYMQTSDDDEGYIMIGSRVDETNALGDVVSHAFAVSTTLRKVVSKVEVGYVRVYICVLSVCVVSRCGCMCVSVCIVSIVQSPMVDR